MLAQAEYDGWGAETCAKRRFRTPRTHATLHAALGLAVEVLALEPARRRLGAGEAAAVETLRARELELASAAEAANAALAAEDYDEAV